MSQIYFILEWHSTCFGRSFHPSSGFEDPTYSNRYMSNRYCWLLASKQSAVSVWHTPVAVFTVFKSLWWTERPSETCRVPFQNKINLRHWCIWLFCYTNRLRCTALGTSNLPVDPLPVRWIHALFLWNQIKYFSYLTSLTAGLFPETFRSKISNADLIIHFVSVSVDVM